MNSRNDETGFLHVPRADSLMSDSTVMLFLQLVHLG